MYRPGWRGESQRHAEAARLGWQLRRMQSRLTKLKPDAHPTKVQMRTATNILNRLYESPESGIEDAEKEIMKAIEYMEEIGFEFAYGVPLKETSAGRFEPITVKEFNYYTGKAEEHIKRAVDIMPDTRERQAIVRILNKFEKV